MWNDSELLQIVMIHELAKTVQPKPARSQLADERPESPPAWPAHRRFWHRRVSTSSLENAPTLKECSHAKA
ncbi:MAG TPA: hypothetical protein PLD59_08065 [Tepidisphaeraceae bacterium]|nr:hypothetical protein [Tepidisphaeraceae bacterium]